MKLPNRAAVLAALALLCPATACDFPQPPEDGDTEGTGGSDGGGDTQGDDDDADDDGDGSLDESGSDESGGIESSCDTEAYSVLTHSGTIGDEVWGAAYHVVDWTLYVEGALTVEPCAIIQMTDGASIWVSDNGSLSMIGEPDARILVTSDNPSPSPGDWNRIYIDDSSSGPANVMRFVDVEYGGSGSSDAIEVDSEASIEISDSTIRYSGNAGLSAEQTSELREFVGNESTDNDGPALSLHPDRVGEIGPGTYSPNGIDGIEVRYGYVTQDATWLAHDAPYIVDTIYFETSVGSAHVQVEAGTTIRAVEGATLWVAENGGLTLAGTAEAPIVIESAKSSGEAGDWSGIRIDDDSVDAHNDFDHVEIRHAGSGGYGAIRVRPGSSLAMTDSTVSDCDGPGMTAEDGGELRDFTGNTLVNNAEGALRIAPDLVGMLGAGTYAPNDVEGIVISYGYVGHDATWLAHDAPYVVLDNFWIDTAVGTANVTVEAGAELRFSDSAGISVSESGSLNLAGTSSAHILLTSAKSPAAAGDWDDIAFHDDSIGPNNNLSYVDVEFGGGGSHGQIWVRNGATASFDNVTFAQSGGGCDVDADGTSSYSATIVTECP